MSGLHSSPSVRGMQAEACERDRTHDRELQRGRTGNHAPAHPGRERETGQGVVSWGSEKALKELKTGLLREIDRLQLSCVPTEELYGMQKLDTEGRYAELYRYAKSLPAGGVNNEPAVGEMSKRLLEMIDTASAGLSKMVHKFAAAAKQYKPAFAAYQKDEVLVLKGESCENSEAFLTEDTLYTKEEGQIIRALHSANILAKVKAVYLELWSFGDDIASELASCLQTHPISAFYLYDHYISDASVQLLAQAAFLNKSLSAFCIAGDEISDTGARAVAQAALNCHSLTTFYFCGWETSDSGAKAVAEAVKGCPLSVFYLGSYHISDAGAKAVAEAVKDCPLSAFCFWSDEMSDEGAIAVAKTVKDCQLSALYLGGKQNLRLRGGDCDKDTI